MSARQVLNFFSFNLPSLVLSKSWVLHSFIWTLGVLHCNERRGEYCFQPFLSDPSLVLQSLPWLVADSFLLVTFVKLSDPDQAKLWTRFVRVAKLFFSICSLTFCQKKQSWSLIQISNLLMLLLVLLSWTYLNTLTLSVGNLWGRHEAQAGQRPSRPSRIMGQGYSDSQSWGTCISSDLHIDNQWETVK